MIAVLIPARNEEAVIQAAIFSCYAAGLEPEDVFVIDDASTDQTRRMAQAANATVLSGPGKGKASAIEFGVKMLPRCYDWVAVLDADSELDPEYINTMRRAIDAYPDTACFCGCPKSRPYNWLTAYRAVEYAVTLGIYREAQHAMNAITVAPGCASVYRREVLESLDFQGGTMVEDMDWTIQMQRRRLRLRHVPEAAVHTQDPRSLRDYVRQIARWYRGTWQVVRRHRLARRRQAVDFEMAWMLFEGMAFALALLASPLLVYWFPRAFTVGLAVDQLIYLAFAGLVAARERRWDVLLAWPLFVVPRFLNGVVFAWAFAVERYRGHATAHFNWSRVERY